MRQREENCWKIAIAFRKKLGGEVWRLSPKFGLYVDRAHEPASGTIDFLFGGIENWTEHAVHVKNDMVRDPMVRDPMMLGHDDPVTFIEWRIHWNHFDDHDFVRIR